MVNTKEKDMYTGEKISDRKLKSIETFDKGTYSCERIEYSFNGPIAYKIECINDDTPGTFSNLRGCLWRAEGYNFIEDHGLSFMGGMHMEADPFSDRQTFEYLMSISQCRKAMEEALIESFKGDYISETSYLKLLSGEKDIEEFIKENGGWVDYGEVGCGGCALVNLSNDVLEELNDPKDYYNETSKRLADIAYEVNAHISVLIDTGVNKMAYGLVETEDGIYYKTYELKDNNKCNKEISLEQHITQTYYAIETLFVLHEQFGNIRVEGNKMFILSYDGEYMYDMDIVHEQYGKEVTVNTGKKLKAELFGLELTEMKAKDGTLMLYSSPDEETITVTADKLDTHSIWISGINKKIILTDNIKKCSHRFINFKWQYNEIKEIIVQCDPELVLWGIINGLIDGSVNKRPIVRFERDIEMYHYGYLIRYNIPFEAPNKTKIQNDLLNDN